MNEIRIPCDNLSEAVEFLTNRLGFRLEMIFPADEPSVAVVSGHGVTIRLEKSVPPAVAGGDLSIAQENVDGVPIISRAADAEWTSGRAGMEYRDLIPGRLGGRLIASHIRLAEAGEVPDYVHYHKVAFQMIFCRRGRVRVVYEDQSEPFWLEPGDCVLQPPEIRHRVLEAGAGTEVIELTSPALHETWADHDLMLPNDRVDRDRIFNGQRFVHHRAAMSTKIPGGFGGFAAHDLGIAAASDSAASAFVLRSPADAAEFAVDGCQLHNSFFFVLDGGAKLVFEGSPDNSLTVDDSALITPETKFSISAPRDSAILCVHI